MYATKLKEAIDVLQELQEFLHSEHSREHIPVEEKPEGMTRGEAVALASMIKTRLPQAEVEVKRGDPGEAWVVEAQNPMRGTSQVFANAEQFEQLMQTTKSQPDAESG